MNPRPHPLVLILCGVIGGFFGAYAHGCLQQKPAPPQPAVVQFIMTPRETPLREAPRHGLADMSYVPVIQIPQ